ncbi:hypothetical protein D3C76_996700 [compost metagenome]
MKVTRITRVAVTKLRQSCLNNFHLCASCWRALESPGLNYRDMKRMTLSVPLANRARNPDVKCLLLQVIRICFKWSVTRLRWH